MNARWEHLCIACATLAVAACAHVVANPGFEDSPGTNAAVPVAGWRAVGDGGTHSLDTQHVRNGSQSLRLAKRAGAGFTGVGQAIDATPLRGEVVRVSAWLRAEELKDGYATVWSRTDGGGRRALSFANARLDPDTHPVGWTFRQAFLSVDPEAELLHFGVTLSGQGTLWVDDFAVEEFAWRDPHAAPLPEAEAYLEEALSKIRELAYRAGEVDWERERRIAKAIAAGATTTADAYPAVSWLLRALKDGHSFLAPPSVANTLQQDTRTDGFGVRNAVVGGKAYLSVPGFAGSHPVRTAAFADDLRGRILSMAEGATCGWIVDLRDNGGGNMYPMLDGLAPLLGKGTLGYFVGRDGKKTAWSAKGNQGMPGAVSAEPIGKSLDFLVHGGNAAIAVLTGPRTASSGEAVAVSFRGRANTRSFGEPTAGQSSGNRGMRLSDGAMLLITTALFADRNGDVFGGKLQPDEPVPAGPRSSRLEDDPVVIAASRWLDGLPSCKP